MEDLSSVPALLQKQALNSLDIVSSTLNYELMDKAKPFIQNHPKSPGESILPASYPASASLPKAGAESPLTSPSPAPHTTAFCCLPFPDLPPGPSHSIPHRLFPPNWTPMPLEVNTLSLVLRKGGSSFSRHYE